MPTDAEVVNQALMLVGNNAPPVTGVSPTFDTSTFGRAAATLYPAAVAAVQRWWGWDAARRIVTLSATGNTPPSGLFTQEYLYPTNGIQVWQLIPGTISDAYNPAPVNWSVGNNTVSAQQKKVIWTNLASARAFYNNNPGPDVWDADFEQAVVFYLASQFAMGTAGKPSAAKEFMQAAMTLSKVAEERVD